MQDLLAPKDIVQLIQLVGTLSNQMGCSTQDAIGHLQRLVASSGTVRAPRSIPAFAERHRSIRLKRNDMMKANAFRDPGWDMLLDLFVSRDQGRPSSTSALCIGSGAPATTALRHIDRLEQCNLVVRRPDRRDHRRTLVELAPGVSERLEGLLEKLQDCY